MILEDVIEAIEKDLGSTLVLHKSIKTHPTIKAYKVFSYGLYAIEGNNIMLLSFKVSKNLAIEGISEAKDDCDKQFISYLVSWLTSDIYRRLKNDRSK